MSAENKITGVLFGFQDEKTGNRLSEFFNKYTGKDIDFNKIHHYQNGFRLMLFSVPLDTFIQTGITAAQFASSDIKKFLFLDDFIRWYEESYLQRIREIEKLQARTTRDIDPTFKKSFEDLGIDIEIKFDPFPTAITVKRLDLSDRSGAMATFTAMDGMLCRVPLGDVHWCSLVMNKTICTKENKTDWNKLLEYFEMLPSDVESENLTRYTPDNQVLKYPKEFDPEIQCICDSINDRLNDKEPFTYPGNWFEVIKKIIEKDSKGSYIAARMLAAPREYLTYFNVDLTSEEIATQIIENNL